MKFKLNINGVLEEIAEQGNINILLLFEKLDIQRKLLEWGWRGGKGTNLPA